MPDPDLMVRTSGEYRISNYLLWESAYSELVFTDVLWPDFRRAAPLRRVAEFQRRDRRFGAVDATDLNECPGAYGTRATLRRGGGNYTGVIAVLYRDQGVVLRTIKLGEADRIVTIFTQGHGKVRAVAKGVRKTSSRFGARLEPASHVALQCYRGPRARRRHPGRDHRVEPRPCARSYGCSPTRCRCSRPSTRWRRSASRTPRSTACSRARCARSASAAPARHHRVLLEAARLEGFHPMLDGCARCGARRRRRAASRFDLADGGMLCAVVRAPRRSAGSRPTRSTCCAGSSVAG